MPDQKVIALRPRKVCASRDNIMLSTRYRPHEDQKHFATIITISMSRSPMHRDDNDARYEEVVTISDDFLQGMCQ